VPTFDENIIAFKPTIIENEPTLRLLATFGEVERMSTSTREMEKLSPSDGAVFPTLLRTGKRGETSKPP
jgi:hypothetical protein